MKKTRNDKRKHRARRVRARISGTAQTPRVNVFRSLTSFKAQVIDDVAGKTLASAVLSEVGGAKNSVEGVAKLGEVLAKKCADAKIDSVVFDRSGYNYHGKVKAFAEALRAGGLKF